MKEDKDLIELQKKLARIEKDIDKHSPKEDLRELLYNDPEVDKEKILQKYKAFFPEVLEEPKSKDFMYFACGIAVLLTTVIIIASFVIFLYRYVIKPEKPDCPVCQEKEVVIIEPCEEDGE